MLPRVPIVTCALILTIAACGKRDPVAAQANNTGNLVAVVDQANATANAARAEAGKPPPPPSPAPATAASPSGAPPPSSSSRRPIPVGLLGRWGLTPADCTSALGDAKGLRAALLRIPRHPFGRRSNRRRLDQRQLRLYRRRPELEQVRGIETDRRQADTYGNKPSSELHLCEMLD